MTHFYFLVEFINRSTGHHTAIQVGPFSRREDAEEVYKSTSGRKSKIWETEL